MSSGSSSSEHNNFCVRTFLSGYLNISTIRQHVVVNTINSIYIRLYVVMSRPISSVGESAALTLQRSLVQVQYRPPFHLISRNFNHILLFSEYFYLSNGFFNFIATITFFFSHHINFWYDSGSNSWAVRSLIHTCLMSSCLSQAAWDAFS